MGIYDDIIKNVLNFQEYINQRCNHGDKLEVVKTTDGSVGLINQRDYSIYLICNPYMDSEQCTKHIERNK